MHETFHEPFRKTLRQSQLRLAPSTAAEGASAPVLDEALPVDLVTPLDPGQEDDEHPDDLE